MICPNCGAEVARESEHAPGLYYDGLPPERNTFSCKRTTLLDWRTRALAAEGQLAAARNAERLALEALQKMTAERDQAKQAVKRASEDGRWAAVYVWLDENKDSVVKSMSDKSGEYEIEIENLKSKLAAASSARDSAICERDEFKAAFDAQCDALKAAVESFNDEKAAREKAERERMQIQDWRIEENQLAAKMLGEANEQRAAERTARLAAETQAAAHWEAREKADADAAALRRSLQRARMELVALGAPDELHQIGAALALDAGTALLAAHKRELEQLEAKHHACDAAQTEMFAAHAAKVQAKQDEIDSLKTHSLNSFDYLISQLAARDAELQAAKGEIEQLRNRFSVQKKDLAKTTVQRRTFSVATFIYCSKIDDKDRVLLIHHKKLNLWLPVGGEIENGELPLEAAKREVREETSFDADRGDIVYPAYSSATAGAPDGYLCYEEHLAGSKGLHMNFNFRAIASKYNAEPVSDGSWDKYRWATLDEIEKMWSKAEIPHSVLLITTVCFHELERERDRDKR